MKIQSGFIYLVDFDPSVGHEIQKLRPALIIGNNSIIQNSHTVPIIPLSTRKYSNKSFEIPIQKDDKNKLFKNSIILANQIYTFDTIRFKKIIGEVSNEVYQKVTEYLKRFLNIP